MISKYAELLSVLLVVVYVYKKIKDRIALWILGYVMFLVSSIVIFRLMYPGIAFFSATVEYIIFLTIVGIPFLVLVVLMGVEIEKRRQGPVDKAVASRGVGEIFYLIKENILFWVVIVLINLLAKIIDANVK